MNVGVLLLAAGRSTRFGSDKRRARLADGGRVIDHTLGRIAESGLPHCVCVDNSDRALARQLEQSGIEIFRCRRAGEGMGSTLAEGVARLPEWDGVLIALADMPWIAAGTYLAIAENLTPDTICIPVHQGRRGHPVGFGRRYWPEMSRLRGDTGARGLLLKYSEMLLELPVPDPAILLDIDEPSDIASADGVDA